MPSRKSLLSFSLSTLNLAAFGYTSVLTILALRANNKRSSDLYLEVQEADQAGVGVTEAVSALQKHVSEHMNASPLPQLGDNAPIQLSYSYERAKKAESARVSAERTKVTNDGIATCEAQFGTANLITRSNCIADYGASHPVQPEKQIVADLYRYDFVSPTWTPDRAGLFLLVSVILGATFILRISVKLLVRVFTKN